MFSTYISARVVAYQEKLAIEEMNKVTKAINAQRQAELEATCRKATCRKTTQGRKLLRSCEDWKRHYSKLQSDVSKTEMVKACDAYVRYITYGR